MSTHATHLAHRPHMGLWQPYCDQCGDIGPGERYMEDASAIAERHQQQGGFEQSTKYPDVHVQLTGEDGNAFAIMGAVRKALRDHGVPKPEIDAYLKESMSGDYDALLRTAMRWVSVS